MLTVAEHHNVLEYLYLIQSKTRTAEQQETEQIK